MMQSFVLEDAIIIKRYQQLPLIRKLAGSGATIVAAMGLKVEAKNSIGDAHFYFMFNRCWWYHFSYQILLRLEI
ncbi:hypothetical protein KHA80_05570 [Anaerobacillus sp. HL2]|nr:hypothetical protein KHA80_05570 [Anaerobacillus sp. HL2]